MKTGLDEDDSQLCVGVNIIFAATEAGTDVSFLFDLGATLYWTAKSQHSATTGVLLRLKKFFAAQMSVSLDSMQRNHREYCSARNAIART